MDKTYNHLSVEDRLYSFWEKQGYFQPQVVKNKKPFVITLPPPNVTGGLHTGHAMYTVEDILVRYHRMTGQPTLWLPGFDHAAIAVEYLVSKKLKAEGKNKKEVGRQEFLKLCRQFAHDSRQYIREQLKKLGFSLDWSQEAYTMDENYSQAVQTAFQKLYQKGLIYQGEYLVNWCPSCQTAISDLENVHRQEKGQLYYLKYGPFVLATTRPETKFGDTAVAVHPDDPRYQKWIDQEFNYQSLLGPKKMKVIADSAVDQKFGTGVVKVTPAHDPADFQIGQRHHLKVIKVIDETGHLTAVAGPFAGLSVQEARQKVVAELKNRGDLVKTETITHSVGHCQRCGSTVEPLISKQWFVKTKSLAQKALEVVKNGQIKILPQHFEKTYFHWLENIQDWCISRQLWWGHKIPLEGVDDVLDTWFSSSLWPIAVFGWPQKTADFKYFYPTTVRETGYDILFFWVTREIMMCLNLTDKVPFETVYLHGLLRDEKNRKFSKTAGIGFDPLDIIQKYGADALRFSLVSGNAPGHDLKIGENKILSARNFTNKIWNAARFALMQMKTDNYPIKSDLHPLPSLKHPDDQQIIKELNHLIETTTQNLESYRPDLAAEEIYQFFWHTFCDQYLEKIKPRLKENSPDQESALYTLHFTLYTCLKLLHPFMPFITEEIYQRLKETIKSDLFSENALIISKWPEKLKI